MSKKRRGKAVGSSKAGKKTKDLGGVSGFVLRKTFLVYATGWKDELMDSDNEGEDSTGVRDAEEAAMQEYGFRPEMRDAPLPGRFATWAEAVAKAREAFIEALEQLGFHAVLSEDGKSLSLSPEVHDEAEHAAVPLNGMLFKSKMIPESWDAILTQKAVLCDGTPKFEVSITVEQEA